GRAGLDRLPFVGLEGVGGSRVSCTRRTARFADRRCYFTSIVVCIQGWMQHWNLWTPFLNEVVSLFPSGGTSESSAGCAGIRLPCGSRARTPPGVQSAHSLSGTAPRLSTSTNPPPKCSTGVNVWNSPPRLRAFTPCSTLVLRGLNDHSSADPSENTSSRKSENVVSPSPTQVPGPTAALNVAGSQSSRISTVLTLVPDA